MTVSAGSDETKVGMARCAVPAAFSGGTLRATGPRILRSVKHKFRACTARGRRSAASLPLFSWEIGLANVAENSAARFDPRSFFGYSKIGESRAFPLA
jgi:hypothetical protein